MYALTQDNALDYLARKGRLPHAGARAAYLSGGVSNLVLRIETPVERFVLKQSCPQLRTKEAWFSDVARVFRELEVMQALEPYLPEGTVPRVLWTEREDFLFAMSHAPIEARDWKAVLLSGEIDPHRGADAGRILATIHNVSARQPEFQSFRDATVFVQLRAEPFYMRVRERRPETARAVGAVLDDMLSRHEALCHGDYTPKNMLIHAHGFTLVDYETAYLGDPSMDYGLFLTHLFLKAMRSERERFAETIRAFGTAYAEQGDPTIEARGLKHLGVCLLARVDGTSPIDYLPAEEQRETVRALARTLLLDGVATLNEALAALQNLERPR